MFASLKSTATKSKAKARCPLCLGEFPNADAVARHLNYGQCPYQRREQRKRVRR